MLWRILGTDFAGILLTIVSTFSTSKIGEQGVTEMFKLRSSLLVACLALVFCIALAPQAGAAWGYRGGCCCEVCCPPPPVVKVLCVKDPCTCCTYNVKVCIPACCDKEEPCVTWRPGIFGRVIATYTWKECGYCLDVVITKHGRVIVRG